MIYLVKTQTNKFHKNDVNLGLIKISKAKKVPPHLNYIKVALSKHLINECTRKNLAKILESRSPVVFIEM